VSVGAPLSFFFFLQSGPSLENPARSVILKGHSLFAVSFGGRKTMARPTSGEKMLDPLPGTTEAKARLAAIVATMSGEKSIPEACTELCIGEARFHEMRKEFLASALGLLERKTAGRKPAEPPEGTVVRLAELEDENRTLREMLEASRIRTEIALTMPGLLKNHAPVGGNAKKKRRRQ